MGVLVVVGTWSVDGGRVGRHSIEWKVSIFWSIECLDTLYP